MPAREAKMILIEASIGNGAVGVEAHKRGSEKSFQSRLSYYVRVTPQWGGL